MGRSGSLLRDGALAGGSSLVLNASTFIFYSASIRSLGVEAGGALLAIVATTLMLSVPSTISGLAFGTAAARLMRSAAPARIPHLVGFVLLSTTFGAVAAVGCGALLAAPCSAAFAVSPIALMSGGFLLAAMTPLLCLRGLVQGMGQLGTFAISNIVETVGRVALSVVLLRRSMAVHEALIGLACVMLAATCNLLFGLLRRSGIATASLAFGLTILRDTRPIFITLGSLTVLTFFDAVAARHFLPDRESGLYNAAALAGRALMTVLAFAPAVIMPKIASTAIGGDRVLMTRQAFIFGLGASVAAATFFVAFPRFVIAIVAGGKFIDAAPIVGIYGVAASALALSTIVASICLAQESTAIALPVFLAASLEVTAIVIYHANAIQLAEVVAGGHVVALIACLIGGRAALWPAPAAAAT